MFSLIIIISTDFTFTALLINQRMCSLLVFYWMSCDLYAPLCTLLAKLGRWGWLMMMRFGLKKVQHILDTSKWDLKHRECWQTMDFIPNVMLLPGTVDSGTGGPPREELQFIPWGTSYHRTVGLYWVSSPMTLYPLQARAAIPDGWAVGVVVSTRLWLLVDHCVLRNWDRILVRAVKGLIYRAGMVSICPLLWQRDVKLQQTNPSSQGGNGSFITDHTPGPFYDMQGEGVYYYITQMIYGYPLRRTPSRSRVYCWSCLGHVLFQSEYNYNLCIIYTRAIFTIRDNHRSVIEYQT